jgi:hypothetical protein
MKLLFLSTIVRRNINFINRWFHFDKTNRFGINIEYYIELNEYINSSNRFYI